MRNKTLCAAVVLMAFLGFTTSQAQDASGNFIPNPGFEDGVLTPWGTYGNVTTEVVQVLAGAAVPEGPIEGDYCLWVDPAAGAANFWNTGLQPAGEVLEKGKKYTVSAFMKAKSGTVGVNMKLELAVDPWTSFAEQYMTVTEEWQEFSVTSDVLAADVSPAGFTFHIGDAVGGFWIDGVRYYEGDYAEPAFKPNLGAKNPNPDDGAGNVARDVILSWEAGPLAGSHNVYFGTSFDDVNDATGAASQPGATYDPDGLLEFGQTYYWRIDEVNATPDAAVTKGSVWSFTVEQFLFPITNVSAIASSSFSSAMGPGKTVDGSGLDAAGLHSVEPTDMWLSAAFDPNPTWIQFEFDEAYPLAQIDVWNSNQLLEPVIGVGVNDVTVEYSQDGETWTLLDNVQLAQAPGLAGYATDTTVNMGGALAQYVRLTANTNWGTCLQQFGLSEVRFYFIPVRASDPLPANGASSVPLDVNLDWRGGRQAVSHDVYFSADKTEVTDGTAFAGTTDKTNFQMNNLDYGQVYYWKVNEVNDTAITPSWEGPIWSFSTVESFALDDFESYNDIAEGEPGSNLVYLTWVDGFQIPTNGSTMGYTVPFEPTMETIIVHGGLQSVPMEYDNTAAAFSEATRIFAQAQDWTARGITEVSIWFRGRAASQDPNVPGNDAAPLYIGLADSAGNSARIEHEDPAATQIDTFTEWSISLSDFADLGVDITSVKSITLGVSNPDAPLPGGSGLIFFDDLTLGNPVVVDTGAPVNLLTNGGFEDGTMDGWGFWGDATAEVVQDLVGAAVPEGPIEGNSALHITVNSAGANNWDYGLNHGGHVFEAGKRYTVSVWLKTKEGTMDIRIKPELQASPWTGFNEQVVTMTDTWTEYSVTTGVFAQDTSPASITFHIAFAAGEFWVDGARFYEGGYAPAGGGTGASVNLLTNGNFESGAVTPWGLWDNSGGGAFAEVVTDEVAEGSSSLHVVVPTAGANFWDVGINQGGYVFEAGKKYTLSALLKTTPGSTFDINFKPELAADPWSGFGEQRMTVTDQWTEYSVTTPVFAADTSPGSITFHIGYGAGEFWMDDVKFYEGDPPAREAVVFDFESGAQGWGGLKDGTAPTVVTDTHSGGGSQSLRVTIDEAANGQQEGGWASPRDFTVAEADISSGGFSTLSFWYRVDDPDFDGGNIVLHWIMSTESWSGGGWYGNGLWGVVIADGQWHQQTADLSILGEAAGGWQGTWGDQTAWAFRDDLRYSFEIAVAPTDNTAGSNLYIDDVTFE